MTTIFWELLHSTKAAGQKAPSSITVPTCTERHWRKLESPILTVHSAV